MTEADELRAFRLRLAGGSSRQVAEQLGCTVADVDKAVDARLPRITAEYRARALALDAERLDYMTGRCLEALQKGSVAAGHLLLKTLERRSQMLGLDAPLKLDVTAIAAPVESSTAELERVLAEIQFERQKPGLAN